MEETKEFDNTFDTHSEELFKTENFKDTDESFGNIFTSEILGTGFHMDVDYLFSCSKFKTLVEKLTKKYGKPIEGFERIFTYDCSKNGGVEEIAEIEEIEEKGTFSAYITMWIYGGGYDWQHPETGLYIVELWTDVLEPRTPSFSFTNPKLACDFLREIVTCIEGVDVKKINERIEMVTDRIETDTQALNNLKKILNP